MDYTNSPWYGLAVADANKYGVPPALFAWQIGQESGFNPNAVNGNAVGIAQFMPGTAADFGLTDRTNAFASLDAAAKYDAQLYQSHNHDWLAALAAYGTIVPAATDPAQHAATLTGAQNALAQTPSSSDGFFAGVTAGIKGAFNTTSSGAGIASAGGSSTVDFVTAHIANYWLVAIGSVLALGALLIAQHKTIVNVGSTVAKTAAKAAPLLA
jgi:hypothetical protein